MPFDTVRYKIFTRRAFVVSTLKAFGFLVILGRVFYLQVLNGKYYRTRADNNRIKSIIMIPDRGIIYDCNNRIIANSIEYYRLILKKINKKADYEVMKRLSSILKFADSKTFEREYNKDSSKEVVLYSYITRKELIDIEFNAPYLPNIYISVSTARKYVHNFAYAHLLGYVAEPSEKEVKNNPDNLMFHPDLKVGYGGIEKYYDHILKGKPGYKNVEIDVRGFKIRDLDIKQPIRGEPISVTIDSKIQEFAYAIASKYKSSCVLMNVNTGEVITMFSTPSFDSNLMSKKILDSDWSALITNERKPLLNRAIQSSYPPGSVFKIVTALTALQNGHDPEKKYSCHGTIRIGGKERHCWKTSGHGSLNLHDAIKHSCNVYFYNLATEYGVDKFEETSSELSLGSIFRNFEFTNQDKGIIPSAQWKLRAYRQPWYPGDTVNCAIGQGFVQVNCLQLATMMSRIASGGLKIEPSLVEKSSYSFDKININPKNLDIVKSGMFDVVNAPGGTAFFLKLSDPAFAFCGKTGTSQVVSKFLDTHSNSAYKNEASRPHGLFAGFAPFDKPKFAIGVICENGGFGSSSAGIVAKHVLHYAQLLNAGRHQEADNLASSVLSPHVATPAQTDSQVKLHDAHDEVLESNVQIAPDVTH